MNYLIEKTGGIGAIIAIICATRASSIRALEMVGRVLTSIICTLNYFIRGGLASTNLTT